VRGRVFCGSAATARAAEPPALPLRQPTPVGTSGARTGARGYAQVKRALDFAVALLGLIALAPLLAVVSLVIKLSSRGPVCFGHAREGRAGREFRCWKFRTMVTGADALQRTLYKQNAVDGPQFKLEHDPRITRVGHWLRKTNIDELPQLINVLCSHMSLIGPRPSPFRENQICVPWRQARLSVQPGITGLWQICRHERDAGDFHQWIYYDILYVRHMSFWLDLKILLATLATAPELGLSVEQADMALQAAGLDPTRRGETLAFEEFVLQPGDSIAFDSSTPHRLSNRGTVAVRAIWVVTNRQPLVPPSGAAAE
jgi:lipopolysaccharide/colanic/teichoic acid biosynthesis glycosyltransferase